MTSLRSYDNPAIVIDVDGTLCETRKGGQAYSQLCPKQDVVDTLRKYRADGYYIIICTARQENTYAGNLGKRMAHMMPVLVNWLHEHNIPFDEIRIDKPWHGFNGFCVDDMTVPPKVFTSKTPTEIQAWLKKHA